MARRVPPDDVVSPAVWPVWAATTSSTPKYTRCHISVQKRAREDYTKWAGNRTGMRSFMSTWKGVARWGREWRIPVADFHLAREEIDRAGDRAGERRKGEEGEAVERE